MKISLVRLFRALLATLTVAALISGCSGCGEEEDLCEGVKCEFGVCNPDDGSCVNAASCSGDDQCLEGFRCQNDICIPGVACNEDGTCDRGNCQNGACVNPDTCTTNANCVEGSYCDDGSCVADPCAETTCDSGVCQIGVGECVNSDTCTTATEADACLDGFRCVSGSCTDRDTFCADLGCDRGVCDFEGELACVNSENCEGSDDNCLAGYFCDENNTCQVNECDDQMVMCDRGVCDATTGDCVNADTCAAQTECTDGFLCVDDACVSSDDACAMGGCPGNQICDYDGAALTATCIENDMDGCARALDCTGERVCDMGICAEATACEADAYEPNDSAAEATNFIEESTGGTLERLTICSGDTDLFTYDTTEDPEDEGTLVVSVDIVGPDVGLGTVSAEITDPDGTSVAQGTNVDNGTPTASIQLSATVDLLDNGEYTIAVSDDGDVTTAGVRYNVAIDLVPTDIVDACSTTEVLQPGMPLVGTTDNAPGTALTTSCGDLDGSAPEAIYTLDIVDDSFVDVVATPQVGNDVALSIRSACTTAGSEIGNGCADASGAGEQERVGAPLPPGTYYVIVESLDPDNTGSFVLSATVEPQICTAADNTCMDMDTASVCNDQRTGFDTVDCDNGCDQTTGACLAPPGEVCTAAVQVDAATGYTGTIDWGNLTDDYDPGSTGCVPDNASSSTDGPDKVFEVTVPDGEVVTAAIEQRGFNYIAAYLVTDCGDVENSCLAGANDGGYSSSDEFLFWRNDTGMDQTVFIIADSEEYFSYGVSPVTIEVAPFVCTPGTRRCILDRESQLCNAAGTGFDTTTVCDNGCDDTTGACVVTNDLCGGALQLTDGVTTSGTVVTYADDYDAGGACGTISEFDTDNGAADAVFAVTTTAADQTVTVDVTNVSGFDPVVWLSDSCSVNNELGPCLFGEDGADVDDADEQLIFFAPTAGDYYVVVEDGDTGGSTGTFDVDVTIEDAQCTPGTTLGCNMAGTAVSGCDDVGRIVDTVVCDVSGCDSNTGRCVNPTGDVCLDAIELDPTGGTITDANFDNDGTDSLDFGTGQFGTCDFGFSSDTGGDEIFYSIDLSAGDLLTVDFTDDGGTYGQVYFQTDCGAADNCFGFAGDGSQTIDYFAETAQTVFVVVDAWTTSSANAFTYDLSWSVSQPGWICRPDTVKCADASTVSTCSSDGLNETFTTCPTSCVNGFCADDAALSDSCNTAVNVGTGATLIVDPDAHTNTTDPTGACDVSTYSDGPDAFFSVSANALDVISVNYANTDSLDDPSTYIFTDCNDIDGTCVGADYQLDDPVTLDRQVTTAGTYIIAVDTDDIYYDNFIVDISVEPGCNPADPVVCNGAGEALEYCTANGQTAEYACANDNCANDECVTRRGDACFDAIGVSGTSGTINGSWANNSNTLEASENPSCAFSLAPDGADDVYAISLQAGELFSASITTDESALQAYILEDCGDAGSCADGRSGDGTDPVDVAYLAENATDIYLVVDRDDSDTDNSYTVDWEITQANCIPDRWSCVDADTVGLCDSAGTAFDTQYDCPSACSAGYCDDDVAAGDDCTTATNIGPGTFTLMDYGNYTNATEVDTCLASGDTDGPEQVYAIDLAANDILDVSVQSLGDAEPSVYVFTDCADPGGSCAGGFFDDSKQASVSYQATVDETVFIAVDDDFVSSNEGFAEVRVDVRTPDCDPAAYDQSCNMAGDGFLYCDSTGFTQEYACQGNGVCDQTTGRCEEPVGDVCLDPFIATPTAVGTPETFSGTLAGFTDDYDLGTGNACTGSRTVGPDPVYAVELTAGQQLTVDAVSTEGTPEDIAVFATPDCTNVRNQCVAGADSVGAEATAETFTYTAMQDETIYLVVDSFFGTASGAFDLTVTVD